MRKIIVLSSLLFLCFKCPDSNPPTGTQKSDKPVITGADQLDILLPKLAGKRVALIVNNTATVGRTHLADTLKNRNVNLVKILAPEHGFRGTADAGEYIKDGIDTQLQIPVVSIYGNTNRKPTPEQLADTDVLIFDIQDVGVRFFTYISTLHYVMEACAENHKKLIVLDRPNPHGSYVDGPVLKPEFKSFVGMHPIPVVHGLTVGELAKMINGEEWLTNKGTCDLEVISVKNWVHADFYSLPIKPSPNLPDDQSIKLYPSIGFLEGSVISVGRGTQTPFQVIGHPDLKSMPYQFTPVSIDGMSKTPPYQDKLCYGLDLRKLNTKPALTLKYLLEMYQAYPEKDNFFNPLFDKLAGTGELKEQLKKGWNEAQIRETWKADLEKYKVMRKKYLLYK